MTKRQIRLQAQRRAERSRSYASEYFSSGAEVQSATNRINDRIRTAVEHFGTDSKIVQDMYSKLDVMIPQSNIRYNKDGIMQIARPYDLYKQTDIHQNIHMLDSSDIKTYGEIKSEYQQAYDTYAEEQRFFDSEPIDIDDYIDISSNILDMLHWAYENQNTEAGQQIIDIMRKKGGHTYQDLMQVRSLYNQGA